MPVSIITPPSVLPVTLTQIKKHLRIDHATDDDYLTTLAEAATAHIELDIRQLLISRIMRQYSDLPEPGCGLDLELYPVINIESVICFDGAGNPVTISSSSYALRREQHSFALEFDATFSAEAYPNGLEVDVRCGYGDTGVDIPSNISRALLVLIGHWYEHRGAQSADNQTAIIPSGLDALLDPVRRRML